MQPTFSDISTADNVFRELSFGGRKQAKCGWNYQVSFLNSVLLTKAALFNIFTLILAFLN